MGIIEKKIRHAPPAADVDILVFKSLAPLHDLELSKIGELSFDDSKIKTALETLCNTGSDIALGNKMLLWREDREEMLGLDPRLGELIRMPATKRPRILFHPAILSHQL